MIHINGILYQKYENARELGKNGYGFFPDGTPVMRFEVYADIDDIQSVSRGGMKPWRNKP